MSTRLLRLDSFEHEIGHSFVCALPPDLPGGDTVDGPMTSAVEIFEDGSPLGPPHSQHEDIRRLGGGRFSHWGGHLYLSASDNTDPRRNGRHYHMYVPSPAHGGRGQLTDLAGKARTLSDWDAYALAESLFYEAFPNAFIGEYGKACWDDAAFVADYLRLVPNNRRSFERKYVVAQLVRALKHLPGELAECGVYNGATAYFMASAAAASGARRALHLFDSFDGLSAPGAADGTYWQAGALAIGEDVARETLRDFERVAFYRGWIPERFDEVSDRQFAFVHVDVDLYEPTLASLRFFYPRTVPGGMLLCDDYGFITCPGAAKAVNEFLADKPEEIVHLPTGQGLIIRG